MSARVSEPWDQYGGVRERPHVDVGHGDAPLVGAPRGASLN